MSNKWIGMSSDIGGILRKPTNVNKNVENKGSDLLVFGYACKIFRDDEKALHIDQGKHLIPWMGDNTLKIDRYDVRATLSDLSQYEPPPGGYMNRLEYLTPAEQKAEQLCEEERYYSLYHNEEEEQMYQEEELKRLHQEASTSYGQVAFDYNAEQNEKKEEQEEGKLEEPDELYSVPANLNLPSGMEMPDTMKQHAIIEKTAKFISTQGAQMEILIKAKQSNNPQFEFLNQNNRLNPYYKFILQAFKDGTYPTTVEQIPQNDGQGNVNSPSDPNYYMNSTPNQSSFAYPSIPVPAIKYKPSASCAYTQLISKIKGVPLPPEQPAEVKEDKPLVPTLLDYNSYYAQQYNASGVIYGNSFQQPIPEVQQVTESANPGDGVEVKKISTGLMLAQCYASDTEDESDHHPEIEPQQPVLNFPIPPDYLQHIIDKTAAYVAKNGKQFEDTLRNKQDDRFLFLDSNNVYHPYYMYKVTGVVQPYPTTNGSLTQDDTKPKVTTPVSFSIKPKDDYSVPLKPALPQETSDDESDSNKINSTSGSTNQFANTSVPEHVQRAIQLVEKQLMIKGAQFSQVTNAPGALLTGNLQRSRFDVDNTGTVVSRPSPVSTISVKPEVLQQKELKRAEEKVKDRLAQIAREKLGLISKEKQLQLERKKKAMAFLTQIKSSGIPLPASTTSEEPTKIEDDSGSDSDKSSVHSIPISVADDKIEVTKSPPKSETPISLPEIKHRSRSKSRSKEKTHKRKKKSKHHSKKKSKKKSHSASRSRSQTRDRSRSHSLSTDRKRRKRSSSRKSKKKRRE